MRNAASGTIDGIGRTTTGVCSMGQAAALVLLLALPLPARADEPSTPPVSVPAAGAAAPASAAAPADSPHARGAADGTKPPHNAHGSLAEVGAKLSNPVSDVWALFTQFGLTFSDGDINTGDAQIGVEDYEALYGRHLQNDHRESRSPFCIHAQDDSV